MGFQFAGKAVYTAVWVAAASLFMELPGFSTQKWLTAGGLGTVLLTLAGREIFTNFLFKCNDSCNTAISISHLDVNKISSIVADMRKVLAKNPQVEQQRWHRSISGKY
ncbi:unnamed protein product [Coffea canephora]|uniref:Uncharacterized protein n=1 Tax=Coffea canephora TaxID=49390 RepID=A0A068TZP9_COFCA|nr:unnamed protein product [Coffea canephora]